MHNSLSPFNTTSVAPAGNSTFTATTDYTFTTWRDAMARQLLTTGNTAQTPPVTKVNAEIGHLYQMLIWNENTVINELNEIEQRQALRPVCLKLIDNFIPSVFRFFSRSSAIKPTAEQATSQQQQSEQLEAGIDTFHAMCADKGRQAVQGSLKERLSAATHDMIAYAEQDRDACRDTYHQQLRVHRDEADITLLSEKGNGSNYLPHDIDAFDKNTFTHHAVDKAEAADDDAQQSAEVPDETSIAIVQDTTLETAEYCVTDNDVRIKLLNDIRQLLASGRESLADFARRLYNRVWER